MSDQQPAPEAAARAIARAVSMSEVTPRFPTPADVRRADLHLRLIRDAIHRDGDDAIRQALGLTSRTEWGWTSPEAIAIGNVDYVIGSDGGTPARKLHEEHGGRLLTRRHFVTEWQEVQP